ncbi:MAG: TlpA family protein disulfide reductase [Alphaproteobacteria bacterium]|nr:TlpA family protein disulfide reductase [Alphaproteobacteria bacterium]
MNKILQIIPVLFLALIIFVCEASAKINIFPQARYIPELSFYGDSGKAYKLKDFHNNELLMAVLWSRTCGPCINDMKKLDKFAHRTKDKGIQVILISPEKEFRTGEERYNFLRKIGAPHLVSYVDRKANFVNGMGVFVTPAVILVNKDNEEVGQITGDVDWDDDDVIDYMLKLKNDVSKKLEEKKAANQQNEEQN